MKCRIIQCPYVPLVFVPLISVSICKTKTFLPPFLPSFLSKITYKDHAIQSLQEKTRFAEETEEEWNLRLTAPHQIFSPTHIFPIL